MVKFPQTIGECFISNLTPALQAFPVSLLFIAAYWSHSHCGTMPPIVKVEVGTKLMFLLNPETFGPLKTSIRVGSRSQ